MATSTYYVIAQATIPPNSDVQVYAVANPGDVVTGGGFDFGNSQDVTIRTSCASGSNNVPAAWNVVADNHGSTSVTIEAFAICQHTV